jgi:hypothetical protein
MRRIACAASPFLLCTHLNFSRSSCHESPAFARFALRPVGCRRDAIADLKRVDQAQSADWNKLMGYSHRKAKTPDFAAAQRYYDSALRIDPQHRGALEYSGELFLMKSDLPSAKSRLASHGNVCGKTCPEFVQLKGAIASYEAGTYPVAARR